MDSHVLDIVNALRKNLHECIKPGEEVVNTALADIVCTI